MLAILQECAQAQPSPTPPPIFEGRQVQGAAERPQLHVHG